jgi:hypothetical protein
MRDSTFPTLRVPEGGAARLFRVPAAAGLHPGGWGVIIAGKPEDARPECLARPGEVGAVLTHDAGLSWPDARGEALADAVLAQGGGPVALLFPALGDALACKRRLEGGAA